MMVVTGITDLTRLYGTLRPLMEKLLIVITFPVLSASLIKMPWPVLELRLIYLRLPGKWTLKQR
jgi:hypothetical protein